MAVQNQSKLAGQLIDLKTQYESLLVAQRKFIKEGASSVEVERKFGKATQELNAQIQKTEKSVRGYINAQSQRAKTDELVAKNINKLESLRSDIIRKQTTGITQVSALVKKEADVEIKLAQKAEREKIRVEKEKERAVRASLRAQLAEQKRVERERVREEKRTAAELLAAQKKLEREEIASFKRVVAARKKAAAEEKRLAAEAKKTQQRGSFLFGFGSAFSGAGVGKAVGSLLKYVGAYRLLSAAIAGVRTVTVDAVKLFVQFGDRIGKIAAVSGATGNQMDSLTEAIRTTAKETRFTANEVADLALSLSKLGATSSQIETLVAPISLAAQALGAGLAETGETILKINNQFNLSAAQTAQTAQVLVGAINGSALSLEGFRTAMSYIGPIANQSNESFQETASLMRVLADNGFQASKIGVGLRKVFLEIKEGGVPLVETLSELADKNISLAEAEKLVGKTGASALLTLVENADTIRILNSETFTYYNTLVSAAAQMSTTAGQADILKSAFQDIQLSIGDAIVNSELFIDLIGLLSTESEKLARSYALLNKAQRENPVELRKTIDQLVAGTKTSSQAALEITRRTYTEGAKQFDAAVALIVSKTKLTTDQVTQLLAAAGQTGGIGEEAWNRQIDALNKLGLNLEKDATSLVALRDKFRDAFNVYDIEEFSGALGGVINQFEEQKRQAQEAKRSEQERLSVTNKYKASLQAISKFKSGDERATALALEAEKKIRKDISDLSLQNLKAQAGLIVLSETAIESNENKINALQQQLNFLKTYTEDIDKEAEEKAKKAEERRKAKELKLLEDALKADKKRVQEEIELKKELLESEKEIYALRIEQATQAGDAQEALRLTTEYTNKEAEAGELLAKSIKDFEEAWSQAYITIDGKKLQNVLNLEDIANDADQLNDSIADLALTPSDIRDWLKTVESSISSVLNQSGSEAAKAAADTVFGEMMEKLKSLDVPQEILDLFQNLFTLRIYPKIDDKAVKEAQDLQDELDKKAKADQKAFDKREQDDIDALLEARIRDRKAFAKELEKVLGDIAKRSADIYQQQQDAELQALRDRLEVEKQLISDRSDYETKVLDAQIQNQLISQEEYASRLQAIKRKEIQQQNAIDKKIFDAEQKRDRDKAGIDLLEALASIIPNLIIKEGRADPATLALMTIATTALASASYASELTAINKRKFYPKKFAEGGVVSGPSHANGGVPFTVSGQGGYEMEGGEYIVNKYSTMKYKSLLDQINGTKESNYKFASGGIVNGSDSINRQLEYLEAIAEATTSTAIGISKPVRAFVSSDDISKNETARRLKERNRNL